MDLFDWSEGHSRTQGPISRPLAYRLRPQNLDEFVGQERILGPGKPLRVWIDTDRVPSLIFWGPPGCGKTTLAELIAQRTQSEYFALSAVLSGVKEIKDVVTRARDHLRLQGRKTLLFVDEIHRFNKSQQDALLPHVEEGGVTLIGATTENPSFEVNSALLSRVRVIRLERLKAVDILKALQRAVQDPDKGLGGIFKFTLDALEWLAHISDGDARRALTLLESAALCAEPDREIGVHEIKNILENDQSRQPIYYDKNAEEHYNTISAFIKSIRDSDPHAALYYLARMLEAGEDPVFVARRLVILASEDIGNADPRALTMALAVKEAVEFVGMPEARINLAQGVTYLALAPKSNASYLGIEEALNEVRRSGNLPIPFHLRNGITQLMRQEGYGKGYLYAHDYSNAQVSQTHLPKEILGAEFYFPKEVGLEAQFKDKLLRMKKQKN